MPDDIVPVRVLDKRKMKWKRKAQTVEESNRSYWSVKNLSRGANTIQTIVYPNFSWPDTQLDKGTYYLTLAYIFDRNTCGSDSVYSNLFKGAIISNKVKLVVR